MWPPSESSPRSVRGPTRPSPESATQSSHQCLGRASASARDLCDRVDTAERESVLSCRVRTVNLDSMHERASQENRKSSARISVNVHPLRDRILLRRIEEAETRI